MGKWSVCAGEQRRVRGARRDCMASMGVAFFVLASPSLVTGCEIEGGVRDAGADLDASLEGGAEEAGRDAEMTSLSDGAGPDATGADGGQGDGEPVPDGHYDPPAVPGYSRGGCFALLSDMAAFDEQTVLGFSGADLLAYFNEHAEGTFFWADGEKTRVTLQASSAGGSVRYDDYPRDQGLCVPSLRISDLTLKIATDDGLLDAQTPPEAEVTLVGDTDGAGGIGLVFIYGEHFDPSGVAHPSVDEAAARYPEHDERKVTTDLSLSFDGAAAHCLRGEYIDEDPNADCNRYDGVLRYRSHPAGLFDDHHNVDSSQLFETALGWWTWDSR